MQYYRMVNWLLGVILVFAQATRAETLTQLYVHDQQGKPVAGAIIEWGSSDGAELTGMTLVDQVQKRFEPEQTTIALGQQVSFPNSDNIRHHVYSFSKAKTFELKLYADTPEQPIMFDKPGVVVLGCNIHDSMVGYIYVSDKQTIATDDHGRARLPSNPQQIWVWHKNKAVEPERAQRVVLDPPSDTVRFESGVYHIQLNTLVPPARDTFQDRFGKGIDK